MTLLDYISDTARRQKLAEDVGSNADYIWQIATRRRNASPKLTKRIVTATGGQVPMHEVSPHIYDAPTGSQAAA